VDSISFSLNFDRTFGTHTIVIIGREGDRKKERGDKGRGIFITLNIHLRLPEVFNSELLNSQRHQMLFPWHVFPLLSGWLLDVGCGRTSRMDSFRAVTN
jgi:hypothetical protein